MGRERRRDGRKEREEGESIRVCIAYAVKRIWADYCSGGSGPVCPEGKRGEQARGRRVYWPPEEMRHLKGCGRMADA